MTKYYTFPDCTCKFHIANENPLQLDWTPDFHNIPLDCVRTWNLISEGNTKGIFQLESGLGQSIAKKLKPENMEHLSALVAILRPGCISGDTKVIARYTFKSNGNYTFCRKTIKELYHSFHQKYGSQSKTLVSYNEKTGKFVRNTIKNVVKTGTKNVYKILLRKKLNKYYHETHLQYYDLKCTNDHKLLTPSGWKQLKDLKEGDRFAILKYKGTLHGPRNTEHAVGQKYFQEICFKYYEYKCVFCDWNDGTLDVNHLEGNRYTNNHYTNLHFVCPNHHRVYSEGKISKREVMKARTQYELPQKEDIEWAEYIGKENCGKQEVFDISMEGPHHNFIAGNIVVHNCSESIRDGKSVTQHYIDRKNGKEEIECFHPSIEHVLRPTMGEMIYQEQCMQIAQVVAGFDLQQADILRKAIGKKKADLMAKVKGKFLEGAKKVDVVTNEEAETLFGWIEKSQRYAFNKSHSVSYAMNAYLSAYTKAHFPKSFFTAYLSYAKHKPKAHVEVKSLISNARAMNVPILSPSILKRNRDFELEKEGIYYGFITIRGIGESTMNKINRTIKIVEEECDKKLEHWLWLDYLLLAAPKMGSAAVDAIIRSGAIDYLGISRTSMDYEYRTFSDLSGREQSWICNSYQAKPFKTLLDGLQLLCDEPVGRQGGCANKNRLTVIKGLVQSLQSPSYSLLDTPAWICASENALLGTSITTSAVQSCDISCSNTSISAFLNRKCPKVLILPIYIETIKVIKTKKGDEMAFLEGTDQNNDSLNSIVIFPDTWNKYGSILVEGNHIMLSGSRGKGIGREESLIVEKVWQI
jgi:DNA polymerase III alpha subunit